MITIYRLIDPRTNAVRYVGRTKNMRWRRLNYLAQRQRRTARLNRWLDELRSKSLTPVFEIIEETSLDKAAHTEVRWIQFYLNQGCDLLNTITAPTAQPTLADSPFRLTTKELRSLRLKYALSQRDLAHILDVHKETVQRWELGKTRIPLFLTQATIELLIARSQSNLKP